ncbi:MAG: hypothetical protein A3F72_14830 [Bacteroidetes bacterium RIFCSPLOWO2_12_FULL_35_15]|nr:MAG: hypothetical protein A3F72_14830 [Bacteroidetes bacterium RIFCSPLOWO2_12_FULL_35_15]
MKKLLPHFLVLLLIFLLPVRSHASIPYSSDYKKIYLEAEDNFANENYNAALPLYLKLDSLSKGNANINFKIGLCYLSGATYKIKSIPYFEEAIKNIARKYQEGEIKETQAPLSTYYYLAKAYHLNYQFDKAIEMYQKYITELGTSSKVSAEIADVTHDIETCNNGKELIKNPNKVKISNLGSALNSPHSDFSPVVSLDESTLIFTSRRQGGTSDVKEANGQYFEDIYISHYVNDAWQKAVSIGPNINTYGHEATVNISADGQKLLIYKDEGGNGNLYLSELKGEEWGIPQYLGANINTPSWETHACFSADNRTLYFVSDRTGGLGGRDIYKCLKLPNGEWSPGQNLGPTINTPYDEDGVFIHPDGKQIYFSSKGHKSMGGFDVFSSIINDENGFWSEPINIGYPINTPDDDIFFITTADGKRSFFSSDQEGGLGEKDIYMITYEENEPRDITILVGRIINNTDEDISNNKIAIIDIATNDTIQELIANSSTGKFGANLPVGTSYKTLYYVNGKEIFTEVLDAPKGKGYQIYKREIPYGEPRPVVAKVDSTKTNVTPTISGDCNPKKTFYQLYFKYNQKDIDENAEDFTTFIDALTACIKSNSVISVEIESSASTVPTKKYSNNEALAKVRAGDAKDIVLKALVKKGINESQVVFSKPKAKVQGKEYKHDAVKNVLTYEKYQYLRVMATIKK